LPAAYPFAVPTYRITIAYDGTDFSGYAANPGVRTVQGELEGVLARILGDGVTTVVAGRTDAGVHARANVVSFEMELPVDTDRLARSITKMLGPEIVAREVAKAAGGFDARFSASWRRYRYRIDDGEVPDPATHRSAWHVPHRLDLAAMNHAAGQMVGEHDFASLCRAAEGRTTVRTVLEAGWLRDAGNAVFDVTATAFCHQMVRSMVALCVDIGRGRVDADTVPVILAARDRNAACGAAPPHGLTLWEVGYERS
jgi:tRNA pseudouridine38-40 synthase